MHKPALLGLAAFVFAEPASATQGLTCRTAGGSPVELSLVLGAPPAVLLPRLTIGGRLVEVVVSQSWIDGSNLWVDLAKPGQISGRELRMKVQRKAYLFEGSIWHGGRRRWVRCRES